MRSDPIRGGRGFTVRSDLIRGGRGFTDPIRGGRGFTVSILSSSQDLGLPYLP